MNRSLSLSGRPAQRAVAERERGLPGQTATLMPPLLGLLTAAALSDWLITRTLTRLAIFVPKTEAMITGYQWLNRAGQVGSSLAAMAALAFLVWIAREEWTGTWFPWLAWAIASLTGLSIVFLFAPPGKLLLAYYVTMIILAGGLAVRGARRRRTWPERAAVVLPASAMLAAAIHQAGPTLYVALRRPGPPAWSNAMFLAGEVLVIAGSAALWLAYGRGAGMRAHLAGAAPPLVFALVFLAEPAMTATIVIWSDGLTLFLPWPLYVGALWLAGTACVSLWQTSDRSLAYAILLLAAAGYAPQLTSQFQFGLIALWILAGGSRAGSLEYAAYGAR